MTTFKAYLIQCITNLHVGSGDANYGVIDKLVQRDPVTYYPTIHASSLKGALREHFEKKDGWTINDNRVKEIFGKESKDDKESESGNYKFLSADLLALPVRCTHKQFALSFDEQLTTMVNQKCCMLTGKNIFDAKNEFKQNHFYTNDDIEDVYAEDCKLTKKNIVKPLLHNAKDLKAFDAQFATFTYTDFKEIIQKLPVIARNNIENGISTNLWYEEIVPHQTIFITYIGTSKPQQDFETVITDDIIQIGANTTVGYGLCKFYLIG